VGSNPIPSTLLTSTVSFEQYLRETKRLAPSTVQSKLKLIKRLGNRVNLWDHEAVERYVINASMTNGHKNSILYAYQDWAKHNGFDYEPRKLRRIDTLPYIPSEKEIDQLVSGTGRKTSSFLQLLKESACRPVEAWSLTPEDFDLSQQICYINKPAKGSDPRIFKMSNRLTAMITRMIRDTAPHERLWSCGQKTLQRNFQRRRKTLADVLANPNLLKISLKTFRHWKATNEYGRTKDILHVKRMLGHRRIENTLVYTHLVDFEEDDQYTVKVASNLQEYVTLLESGFEYISDFEDKKILRKRK